jgi:hypothetical protein
MGPTPLGNTGAGSANAGALDVGLDARDEMRIDLPIVTRLKAAKSAVELIGRVERAAAETDNTCESRIAGCECDRPIVSPRIAAVDARVEPVPGIDRNRRANGLDRHVGGLCRTCDSNDKRSASPRRFDHDRAPKFQSLPRAAYRCIAVSRCDRIRRISDRCCGSVTNLGFVLS